MIDIRIMTYNVLHIDENPANKWEERKELIKKLIERESPDIIGTQECLYSQIRDIIEMLPEYEWLGLGRLGGSNGDFMTIYFRKDRFVLLEYDHFWLSDTPEIIGSMTFGNETPRMVTWGKFLDRRTGNVFYHMNTHLDYLCEEARKKAAVLIQTKVKEFQSNLPVFLTGDFNTDINTEPYDILTKLGSFKDTWDLAREHVNKTLGTKNDFIDKTGGDSRIDWILSKGVQSVKSIKIIDDCVEGSFPSDHFAVIVNCKI
ncbi:endonuclease/exonuclease/phosphatase family protein [Bacillus sp. REN16]|uniref:endonuclease/exonuclease/phosphatase family protein n=1 Tax=Bacillus sp. REN16 TaxID=2887296 RepID=UPI001E2EF631|nr:endonuclease/exonuclease/phosphatase family protein [Bacillus sp. REN16]MCC3355515.1 endonuclease/exonuclease/phosphatase family protein [Bacillus sp. REN16]